MDSKLLKCSSYYISEILCQIINVSILTSTVPDDWKKARVCPIYKGKGSKSEAKNYRPISVLSHVSKIVERCIYNQLIKYVVDHHFISIDQSAYLSNHSTQTALHKVIDEWLQNIDDHMFAVVCYFDISKCFDCINHEILLFELQKYGIRQKELEWFTSYISGRLQATFAHNTLSSFFSVTTGIPQGSILGPLLFLLYLNDLPKFIYNCSLYADDTMIQRSGTNIDSICNDIQNDVNKISQWFEFNKLTLNVEKSCIMLVGSKPNIANISTNDIIS